MKKIGLNDDAASFERGKYKSGLRWKKKLAFRSAIQQIRFFAKKKKNQNLHRIVTGTENVIACV